MTGLLILYTANIRGDLDLLPRMYTFIRRLKTQPFEDEADVMLCAVQPPAPNRTLLLDLGNSCAPGVWHCEATGGRSVLLVMDAMGYHAINVSGQLTPEARERIQGNAMAATLVDEDTSWIDNDIAASIRLSSLKQRLQILLTPQQTTQLEGKNLHLANVEAGQVGLARLAVDGAPHLLEMDILTMPASTLPDPTIAGTVDFVTEEARYFQKRRQSNYE